MEKLFKLFGFDYSLVGVARSRKQGLLPLSPIYFGIVPFFFNGSVSNTSHVVLPSCPNTEQLLS